MRSALKSKLIAAFATALVVATTIAAATNDVLAWGAGAGGGI